MTEHGQASGPARAFVSGVILAAGRATRMGRPKTGLRLGDKTLLQHVIANATASCLDEVIVVLASAPAAASIELPVRAVVNDDAESGQSGSLGVGLRATNPAACAAAVLLADQPDVDPATIDFIVSRALSGRGAVTRPVYHEGDARTPGHPVVIRRHAFDDISARASDSGARDWIRAHPDVVDEIEISGPRPRDIDTPEDYARASAQFRRDH